MSEMPLILAIETTTSHGSLALARGGELLSARSLSADRRHTSELFTAMRDLLAEFDAKLLDVGVFAYSKGPGSFTGLRVAATVARMVQSSAKCQVVAVPTLEVVARNAMHCPDCPNRIVVALDARRDEVFGATYERTDDGGLRELTPAVIHDPKSWLTSTAWPFAVLGDGVRDHESACESAGGVVLGEEFWTPRADSVAAIAWECAQAECFTDPADITPLYIRPPACEEVYEQKRAAARAKRGE